MIHLSGTKRGEKMERETIDDVRVGDEGLLALEDGRRARRDLDPVAQHRILAGDSLAGHIEADLLREALGEA
jgi:hypothetical protein